MMQQKHKPHQQTKNQGFTLIESLIALLIVGITLGGLIGSYGQNTRYLTHVKEKAMSQLVLNNLLVEKRLGPKLSEGRSSDSLEFGYQTWYWQLLVAKFQTGEDAADILQAELKVFASKADKSRKQPIQIQKFYVQK